MRRKPKTKVTEKTPTATTPIERRPFRAHATREVLAIDPQAFDFLFEMSEPADATLDDGIAVLNVDGPLEHHAGWWFDNYDSIVERVSCALADEGTKALVLCIDSPGGEAAGMVEMHRKIRSLREQHDKPIYAYANEQAASAAYGLASAADEIWLPETALVGSVGVIACVYDRTEANKAHGINVRLITTGARKGDGHPDKPLTKDVIASLQDTVDTIGASFFGIVAESRKMSVDGVQGLEAGVFYGADAIEAGLADRVGNFDELMAYVRETARLAEDNKGGEPARTPNRITKESPMNRAAALKAVNDAKAAVLSAKTDDDRKKFLAQYEAAMKALAKTEDVDDGDKKKDDKDPDDDGDKDAEDEESEEDEMEEDEDDSDDDKKKDDKKDAKALGARDSRRLFAACRDLTGKRNLREVLGALSAMGSKLAGAEKLRERVTRLESENKRATVNAMLAKAKKEGRVTPAEAKVLEAQGLKDPKFLKGYLATLDKKRVRSVDDGAIEGASSATSSALAQLNHDQQKMVEQSARMQGRPAEDLARELLNNQAKKTGAVARH